MIGMLIDGMFPARAAGILREQHGCDAHHVAELGLAGADDASVAAAARAAGLALVTENAKDFAGEPDVVKVFVLKRNLVSGAGLAAALAEVLARWGAANPEPYLGPHWPR